MKIKVFITALVFLIIFASCIPTGKPPETPVTLPSSLSLTEYFPLKTGTYWVYRGLVKWSVPNLSEIQEEEVTWKMEVVQEIRRNDIAGYIMRGAPWDLAWYEEEKAPSNYGIIRAGGRFYRTSVESILRLQDQNDTLVDLVNDHQFLLDIPLIAGKKFCDTLSITREDNMYCWIVGQDSQLSPTGILGIDTTEAWHEFPIYYQTLPDSITMHFIPGIGISGYGYLHHGTVSEVDVRLVEFHPGE